MLDFDLDLTEVSPSFPVGILTSGGIPDDVSDCELGNSNFRDQTERTISVKLSVAVWDCNCAVP